MANSENENIIKVPRFKEENGFYTTFQRSSLMSKIKSKNTSPELLLRKALWASGFRYRLHHKKLPGNPDIILTKFKVVVFIDGEFWHGYNWQQKKIKISANRGFWIPKIERNMQRDVSNNLQLAQMGLKVFRFWEQEIKKDLNGCLGQLVDYLNLQKAGGEKA
jgi:DNA mismatch endonuclease (patch repair protein)